MMKRRRNQLEIIVRGWLALVVLSCVALALAPPPVAAQSTPADAATPLQPSSVQSPQSGASAGAGTITGTVIDKSGALVAGAKVTLTRDDGSPARTLTSNDDGLFTFANLPIGRFHLSITAPAFAPQIIDITLNDGETVTLPPVKLLLATEVTQVQVVAPQEEVAEAEIKVEEQQRVLGFIPNFYVSYIPDAAPLDSRQKFELAWRSTLDPVTIILVGANAGIEQASNTFGAYGQGAEGYGKRFGASYADTVTGTFLGGFVFPVLLRQDPRYFYKGTGSIRSRVLYAVAMSVVTRGDNKKWQPNYSGILGSVAAGGISNLYYPPNDRGAGLIFENTGIGIATAAAANILQEFVIKKLTPNANRSLASPSSSHP